MSIISLSLPKTLLDKVDEYIQQQGFANRSEVVRQALRAYMSESRILDELQGRVTAVITLIYKREAKRNQITDLQHNYSNTVLTFLHTHVEADSCIEIIVARGDAQVLKSLIQALKANKQISEVKVTIL
ncbi:MAG: ribbon-helix-helix protein, CopG family [Candidatus Bathyarchaeota archaeon]|nr:ribbon-helix-helix protein, CopG family [Candidatus Bathyarchaeota archaeon]